MRIGFVGLGKMGANMSKRLLQGGHEVVGFDIDEDARATLSDAGGTAVSSLAELVKALEQPRAVWVMVPSGDVTGATLDSLAELMDEGDRVIDGGNSRYTDTVARAERLEGSGLHLLDAGTSGGIWGLDEGYCLMVGGAAEDVEAIRPIFETLAPADGWAHVGKVGAGHFTKMVHNGVEYALMQSYGEGFEILHRSDFDLDVAQVANVWRHGSVVRSWLLDLAARALEDSNLSDLDDYVADSGEGRWTLHEAIDAGIPAPTIAMSLFARFASQQEASYAGKMIAALRREFGGHAVRSIEDQGEEGDR